MLKYCCRAIAATLATICAGTGADAGATSPVFLVNTTTIGEQTVPNIAPLKNGGFVIIWTSGSIQNRGGPEDTELIGQRYNPNGTPAGNEFRVNTYTNNTQFNVSVAGLNNGGFIAAWTSYGQDSSGDGVYAQRFDGAGNRVGSEFLVNVFHQGGYQGEPAVAALSNGGFVIMWVWSTKPTATTWKPGVYGQIYNANGTRVGGEFRINADTTKYQGCPAAAGILGGGFVATWTVVVSSTRVDLYAQRYNSLGQKLGGAFKVDDNITPCRPGYGGQRGWGDTGRGMIAPLTVGGYVVVWRTPHNPTTGFGFTRAQRFSATGVRVGNRIDVNTYNGSTSFPDVSATFVGNLSDGGFLVTWQQGSTVMARRYTSAGAPASAAFEVDHPDQIYMAPQAAKLKNGGFIVTWQAERDETPDCIDHPTPECSGNRIDAQLFGP